MINCVFWVRPKADAVVLRGRWYDRVLCKKSMLKLMNQSIYKPPCLVLLFVCSLSYTYPWRHNERLRTRLFSSPNRRTGSWEGGECVRLFQSSPPNEPRCDHIGEVVIHISKYGRLNRHARNNSGFSCSDCPYCKIMWHSQGIRVTHFWFPNACMKLTEKKLQKKFINWIIYPTLI